MGVQAAQQQGSRGRGALAGAQAGMALGSFGGPIGMGIGAAAGAIYGAVTSGGPSVNDMRDHFMALQGGLTTIQETMARFNNDPQLVAAFNRLYFTGKEGDFEAGMAAYMRRLQELQGIAAEAAMLGLSWMDQVNKGAGFQQQIDALFAQRDRLAGQGFESAAIV
jgi:hypothetical protein